MTSHCLQNLQTSMPIQSDKELVLYKLVPISYQKISQHFTTLIVFWCNLAILCKHENTLQNMSIITSRSKNNNTGKIVIHVLSTLHQPSTEQRSESRACFARHPLKVSEQLPTQALQTCLVPLCPPHQK
jgi:hypothetical protein